MKYISFKRYNFSTIGKKINNIRSSFLRTFRFANLKFVKIDYKKTLKLLDLRRYNFFKLLDLRRYNFLKLLDLRRYNFYRIDKKINFKSLKYLPIYFAALLILAAFVYVSIPFFYSYDKSKIIRNVCKNQNIECVIKGKVGYSFFPTPRIKIRELVISDFFEKKTNLITAKDVSIKLALNQLLKKEKQIYKKIELKNFEINYNLKNLKKYKIIFSKNINFIPTIFTKGKIIFSDGNDYVASIDNLNLNLNFDQDSTNAILKGKFLGDKISASLETQKKDEQTSSDFVLKISKLNLLTKTNFFYSPNDKNILNGTALIKKDKNKITALFEYNDNKIKIKKSNLRNLFIDGNLEGIVTFSPYFNFDLDVNLNSINFTKLYSYFLSLDKEEKQKIFQINNKINGDLVLSTDRIYSSYNLIKSFESRTEFKNGKIFIKQFLFNLGKLGAADLLGVINEDKKFNNIKFESNVFIDNQKKFLSKFGIYNKEEISSNLFVSGNFDYDNLKMSFYEISDEKKFSNEDINYIEQEFNNLMLEDGYTSLFYFPTFKEFIKSITSESD